MTAATMEPLAARAVACKGWKWMPGMMLDDAPLWTGCRVSSCGSVGGTYAWGGVLYARSFDGAEPDLTDPATLGCLLALVREAWKMPDLSPHRGALGGAWYLEHTHSGSLIGSGATEAGALVAALEAAP